MTIRDETLSLINFLLDRRPGTSDPELLAEILARAQSIHCLATSLEHDIGEMEDLHKWAES